MKTILCIAFLLLCPIILGLGTVTAYNKISSVLFKRASLPQKKPFIVRLCAYYSAGFMELFLLAGVTNALGVFLSLTFSATVKVFALLLIAVLTFAYLVFILLKFASLKNRTSAAGGASKDAKDSKEDKTSSDRYFILFLIISLFFSALALFITLRGKIYLSGDQTVETVNSFLSSNEMYSVNPLTGLPYDGDHPSRLDYMFLPFFYALLCRTFDLSAMKLLYHIIPAVYAVCAFSLFVTVGDAFFFERAGESDLSGVYPKTKVTLFYMICVFLLFCCGSAAGSISFNLFHSGFRSGSFLILLLVNYCLALCIKKRWAACLIPIVLEPLAASTKFGIGACFVMTASLFVISKIRKKEEK